MGDINITFQGKPSKLKQDIMKKYLAYREDSLIYAPLAAEYGYNKKNSKVHYTVKITGSNVTIDVVVTLLKDNGKKLKGSQKIGFETTYQDVLSYLILKLL